MNPIKRGRGRPKLGNVLFAKRVAPSKIPAILEMLKGCAPISATDKMMLDNRKLLDDIARLENELDLCRKKLEFHNALDQPSAGDWKSMNKLIFNDPYPKNEFDQT